MKRKKKVKKLWKLDLGCGMNRQSGFTGVDNVKTEQVDIVHDLLTFPWPFETESVEEVFSSHFFEHVPAKLRFKFMDELYRVMVTGAKATFITPYWSSMRAVQDPTHEWPPICEASYLYFNRGWREANKIGHYMGKCDFDFSYGYFATEETKAKNQEAQQFSVGHYINAVNDLQVTLTKRPCQQA